jgi:hypothetical protein
MAIMWLKQFAKKFGDKLPTTLKFNLPSSMTRGDVYQRMKMELENEIKPCSQTSFLSVWRKELKHIIIPKVMNLYGIFFR